MRWSLRGLRCTCVRPAGVFGYPHHEAAEASLWPASSAAAHCHRSVSLLAQLPLLPRAASAPPARSRLPQIALRTCRAEAGGLQQIHFFFFDSGPLEAWLQAADAAELPREEL